MPNHEHVEIIRSGVDAWNSWRKAHSEVVPQLSTSISIRASATRVDLADVVPINAGKTIVPFDSVIRRTVLYRSQFEGADIAGINLSKAQLSGLNFSRANLDGADLSEANLRNAVLTKASLKKANFNRCFLRDAVLDDADLTDACLDHADLVDASLVGAQLSGSSATGASFIEANLTGALLKNAELGELLNPRFLRLRRQNSPCAR